MTIIDKLNLFNFKSANKKEAKQQEKPLALRDVTSFTGTPVNKAAAKALSANFQATQRLNHDKNISFKGHWVIGGHTHTGGAIWEAVEPDPVMMKKLQLEEMEIEADKKAAEALRLAEHEKGKQKIKDKITKGFIDLVELEQKTKTALAPNCLMLSGESSSISRELIEWTSRNSDCNFIKVLDNEDNNALQDTIIKHLEQAEENYQKNGKRTLINVHGFDRLLNPEINSFGNIEDLRDIMSSASKDFHSTIVFNTKDSSKLDQIALQPHRIKKIDVPIKSLAEEAKDIAAKRDQELVEIDKELAKRFEHLQLLSAKFYTNPYNSSHIEPIQKELLDPDESIKTLNNLIKLFLPEKKKTLDKNHTKADLQETLLAFHEKALGYGEHNREGEYAGDCIRKLLHFSLRVLGDDGADGKAKWYIQEKIPHGTWKWVKRAEKCI